MKRKMVTVDGCEAAAYIAYHTNEVIAIYPITPSSPMAEWADTWNAKKIKNIWGMVPSVTEMQSEGGAVGAVHGALQTGAMTTTFTASQGLLLMIPNMFKIAGELTPTVFNVTARTIGTHALSIYGDHSDVMAVRGTGWAMLCSNSVQEVMDLALISQAAALESRVPFVHFFDGFRTSHEVMKIEQLAVEDIRAMIDDEFVYAHRSRRLSPDKPSIKGTAQNPDVFFQAREACNPYYLAVPGIVQKAMDKFAAIVGRQYHLFDYYGAPDAERVLILMGSGAEASEETVEYLNSNGDNVGVLKVRLFRPFSGEDLIKALPATTKTIAVLDRTKEPGSNGEPLYKDVVTAVAESFAAGTLPFKGFPKIVGGRYGLSSKEFTPAMIKGVYDELKKETPKNYFSVGINDDVTHNSIDYDPKFEIPGDTSRCLFYGLGADGTVGANKNSIKIIGEDTPNHAQGYFSYDSRKSGTVTVSHLRFGAKPIHSIYLVDKANFIACHQFVFLEKYDMLKDAVPGATFLLNSPFGADEVWDKIPQSVQKQIIEKNIRFFVIDGYKVAKATGMGNRVNTIMQTCFFAISGVLPKDEAIDHIKKSIKKTYGAKGEEIVQKNYKAVDETLANLFEVKVPGVAESSIQKPPAVPPEAPEYVQNFTARIIAGEGDALPVSAFTPDGSFPSGTAQWEKRNITLEIPAWDPNTCIQCGKCSATCPHASIRIKAYDEKLLKDAPATFKSMPFKGKDAAPGMLFTIQVAPEDCTGCGACVEMCPARNKKNVNRKAINMTAQPPVRFAERDNFKFFLSLPDYDRKLVALDKIKSNQLLRPLFEFSGACAGCGETPYIKMMTQLFGDRALIANATGCSSIYGGNLPTTPYTFNSDGRGPAWSNSLFEDNAEFGLGFRMTVDKHTDVARDLVRQLASQIGDDLANALLEAGQKDEADFEAQRERVQALKEKLAGIDSPEAKNLFTLADYLVKKSVWIVGGDGWAYDIGYGGLDHVLASGRNINILVLDTEVYSNTGGQMSKSTPRAAVAKFATAGKPLGKKDLGMHAMNYGNVYVAAVAMGANDAQAAKAFTEAESYDGVSIIIAYSHCIAHGINMTKGMRQQQAAVNSGHWLLYRYDPRRTAINQNPLVLDSGEPTIPLKDYIYSETRYKMLTLSQPEEAAELLKEAQEDVHARRRFYKQMAGLEYGA
ncbi:MAG: pyruvate:ferredoxin (flavodoxin) oxidoreductase [Acidobacteriota bacterium]|jgi:pyruvate-ferredoxin/flavodoxin oxidoreductase|nr:pyruvate:ferredoxin (flavodoxin) oxidoreductase [Acidobacteriota bacterium]